jgi:very-short-patch-repair endonuclease
VEKLTQRSASEREARAIDLGRVVAEIARRQHGVISRRQLVGLGLDRGAIDWRLRSGRLHRVHRGVYAFAPGRLSQRSHWLAAVLAYGEEAVLSHLSAAALWGLLGQRGPVDVTCLRGRPGRHLIRLHRTPIEPDERTSRNGIPTTTVARTLLDLAQIVDPVQVKRAWEEADRLNLLQLKAVMVACDRAGTRRGSGTIRRLLSEARAATVTRSPLEDRFLAFCRDHRLPTPATNILILGKEVDAYWPSNGLAVELDSFEFHRHRAAFERDRARDAAFLAAGYRVIRLTDRRLETEASEVAAQLRELLAK